MSNKLQIKITAAQIAALVEEQLGRLACTLRPDYLACLDSALTTETSSRGREVLEMLVANARLAASQKLPLCQDTGYVWVCLEISGAVEIPANVFSLVDAAVAQASITAGMRMSMLRDALIDRSNTNSNTPVFTELLVAGARPAWLASPAALTHSAVDTAVDAAVDAAVENTSPAASAILHIMLKGGGSDNASALAMLPPGAGTQGVLDFVVEAVSAKGANACPPLVIGVGVGGSFDSVASLAKYALLRPLGTRHPVAEVAALEAEILARINALGIGPGGLGGSTTAFGAHINTAPCHIAALPVAVNIGCTALRSVSLDLGERLL